MKFTLSLFLLVGSLLGTSVIANDAKPCHVIKEACEAGGYKKGGHKTDKKGLKVDCIQPIMAGQTVAGVNVTADQVAACKAKHPNYGQGKHK